MSLLNSNVNEKVEIFNSIIFNILSNVRPSEAVGCSSRDPPCFRENITRKYFFPVNIKAFKQYLINY